MPLTFTDNMRGEDRVNLEALLIAKDQVNWRPKWTIHRFARDPHGELTRLSRAGIDVPLLVKRFPKEYLGYDVYEGNLLLNTGINSILWPLILGSGGTALNNANAYIGVGDNATAASASQTGLLASTNIAFAGMNSGYPSFASQVASWQATFASSVANFAWNEICVANANTNASGTVVNRLQQTMGTKASPAVWLPILQITLS
jgi:hypothetical protein